MKRILVTESQYSKLVKLLNEQFIKFNHPEDEKDVSHDILDALTYLTGFFAMNKIKKDVYVDKIERGVVYLDATKYSNEEREQIEKIVEEYVDFDINPRDKVLSNVFGFDSGIDSDWVGGDVAEIEDNDDSTKYNRDRSTTIIDTPKEKIEQIKKGSGTTKPTDAKSTSPPTANRWGKPHHGYDIVGPYKGNKCLIVCNKPGIVTYADRCGTYGNLVEIKHGDGNYSSYAHLDKIYLTSGQRVGVGDVIGTEGKTGGGRITGRHLHFEERVTRPKGFKSRCGEGSPWNEVYGYNVVKPPSILNDYFYFQQGV
jgi:murein DD-endopeptidase MepM/ murein hydrolase activator NlpD